MHSPTLTVAALSALRAPKGNFLALRPLAKLNLSVRLIRCLSVSFGAFIRSVTAFVPCMRPVLYCNVWKFQGGGLQVSGKMFRRAPQKKA